MASTVTELTLRAFASNSYDALSTTVGLVAILALVVLLIGREAMKATASPDLVARVGPITALSIPLLAPWVLVTAVRLISLL
jgi:uncharacterized membrane protein YkgB